MPIPDPLCPNNIDYGGPGRVCSDAVVQATVARLPDLGLAFVDQQLYLVQKLVITAAELFRSLLQVLFNLARISHYALLILLQNYTLVLLFRIWNLLVLFLLVHPVILLKLELLAWVVLHYFLFLPLAVLCFSLLLPRSLLTNTLLFKCFLLLFLPLFVYHMLLLVIDESIPVVHLVWVVRGCLDTGFCWFLLFAYILIQREGVFVIHWFSLRVLTLVILCLSLGSVESVPFGHILGAWILLQRFLNLTYRDLYFQKYRLLP